MGFDGGSGFVPGNTGGGPPPPGSDVYVGNSLFVSIMGSALGQYENLTNHFDDIDDAIAALQRNDDVIYCYYVNQNIISTALPSGIDTLNLVIFGKNSNIEFTQDIAGLDFLNIQTEGDIKFIQKQTSISFCNIICQNLNTYEQLKTIVCTFNITVYDTLTTAFYFNGSGTRININANKIIGNVNITNPSSNDRCFIKCNTYNGLFFLNIGNDTDWKFVLEANRIFYVDPASSATAMFAFTSNNSISNISKFIIRCPDIYWECDNLLIDLQSGVFGFKNCTFTHKLTQQLNVHSIIVQQNVGLSESALYLKNCDHNFLLSNGSVIFVEDATGLKTILVYIENCNFYANGGIYPTVNNYVINTNTARDYYGISGNADQNYFIDFASPLLTNIAGSPNVQLINYLPKL